MTVLKIKVLVCCMLLVSLDESWCIAI